MNEKTMVADALTGVNGELKMFGSAPSAPPSVCPVRHTRW